MRKSKPFVFIIFLSLISFFGNSQSINENDRAKEILIKRGEVFFRFHNNDISSNLSKVISVDRMSDDNWVYAYANKKEFETFSKLNIDFEVLTAPGLLNHPHTRGIDEIKSADNWDYYPTYDAYEEIMYQFQSDYPGLCDVFSIGTTVEGRKLLVAKISDNVNTTDVEPRFLYTSTMHGDETGGYITMLHLIDYLLSGYGTDDKITELINNTEIWINPLANPDGTYALGNNSVWGAKRYNGNNIDLNRNYPDPEDGPHPDGNEWQPETEAFMALADSVQFTMSVNIHSGSEVCNYPWDTWSKLTADDDWWQFVCREYADTAQFYSPAGYMTQLNNGITNGYAWYSISGGRQDYMNYFAGCREFTLEISNTKLLMENKLLLYWEYNYRSLLNYAEQVLYGFQGVVTDSETGEPLAAKLTLVNHDTDNSFVYADANTGSYFRPVFEGTYDLKFSLQGYLDKVIPSKSISNYETSVINVEMEKDVGIDESEFGRDFTISPNPATDFISITYSGEGKYECQISMFSSNSGEVYSAEKTFSKGSGLFTIDISEFSSGVYIIRVTSKGNLLNRKVIKK